jgi:prophage regulatory protein
MPNEKHPDLNGFLRLSAIIGPDGPIPISRSSWWAGVASGHFPKPVKLGPRTTAWRVEDIAALIQSLSEAAAVSRALESGPCDQVSAQPEVENLAHAPAKSKIFTE